MNPFVIKPPTGVMPREVHEDKRISEITNAIERYLIHGYKIPEEWVEEYNELITRRRAEKWLNT